MSVQENKALARRVFDEVWSGDKLDLADDLLADGFVDRSGGLGEPFSGPDGAKEFRRRLREGYPDLTFDVEDMIGEGDLVATRWRSSATHKGKFMGFEPTQRQADVGGMTFLRFRGGRVIEGWTQMDTLHLMVAVGAPTLQGRKA